jgi:hypothetical protein
MIYNPTLLVRVTFSFSFIFYFFGSLSLPNECSFLFDCLASGCIYVMCTYIVA